MADHDAQEQELTASPGYAWARLERALRALETHTDPQLREQAARKAERWRAVLSGMAQGTLTVGSRTPLAETPAWVTLEVAHGGFATGTFLAEGPLQEHETELLARLPQDARGVTPRERLNLWFLSDEGLAELTRAIHSGRFRVELPEEGALLVVAWLLERSHVDLALDLIAELRPLMHRLRFYPRRVTQPRPVGALVRLKSAGEVAADLRATRVRPPVATMNEALRTWNPLYDRLVALWGETVEGSLPRLEGGRAVGGWPCTRWPRGWGQRREAWLADYRSAAQAHPLCGKHRHRKSNFNRLREVLEAAGEDGASLDARQVGWVRRALANTHTRRGEVGSQRRTALREQQAAWAARPSNAELAQLVAARLGALPPDGGLPDLEPLAEPAREGEHPDVPQGWQVPQSLVGKAARALEAPLDELIARGVIGSSEVLASVLPQLTAQVAAAGIADGELRALYEQVYGAFRRRRSLLLLNLERQVQLEELPWVAALDRFRRESLGARELATQTLEQVTLLALASFPQTLLPNPLVSELGALAQRAGRELPLTQEVAADIFMGTFTATWRRAAELAARCLEGTLYARYYDLPPAGRWSEPREPKAKRQKKLLRWGREVAQDFADLCRERAEAAHEGSSRASWVAKNGTVIEQSQILTTHNLAILVAGLQLEDRLRGLAPALAEACFAWIVRRQTQRVDGWRAQLQTVKNSAYAWRQAVFFLSFCTPAEQSTVLGALAAQVDAAKDRDWAVRFDVAVEGLRRVLAGASFDAQGAIVDGRRPVARRFLGWSLGKHWLLA